MKFFSTLFKYLVLIFIVLLTIIMSFNISIIFPKHYIDTLIYIILFLSYSILYIFFFRKKLSFVEVFIHEFTHLIFAIFTFKHIKGFFVERESGYLSYKGSNDFLISLSPYFFPIVLVFVLILSFSFDKENLIIIKYIVVVLYASFLLKTIMNWSFNDPDIKNPGKFYSFIFVISMQIILFIVVCDFIFQNFSNFELLFQINL